MGIDRKTMEAREPSNFEAVFYAWLDRTLSPEILPAIAGFSFNLIEIDSDAKFAVELIGSSIFSKDDTDWACDEIFSAMPRRLEIPLSYSGSNWDQCLDKMMMLAITYLPSNCAGANRLNSAEAVAIGFVDGDLYLF